ncbi:SH2 domain-containing protein 1A-like isoform X2 [Mobula hypostoma]|uniref:SH2 domain-containing protein 1A-like isoform X2 n=1 Tax=Mobula hypostoma TaxID=723540 RepID=UPI002FC2C927
MFPVTLRKGLAFQLDREKIKHVKRLLTCAQWREESFSKTALNLTILSFRKSASRIEHTNPDRPTLTVYQRRDQERGREIPLLLSLLPGTMRLSVYHGGISLTETEDLLASMGKDGSYLIRDSETIPGVYCLCVLNKTFVHTYRISETSGKWSVQKKGFLKMRYKNGQLLISPLLQIVTSHLAMNKLMPHV